MNDMQAMCGCLKRGALHNSLLTKKCIVDVTWVRVTPMCTTLQLGVLAKNGIPLM